MDTMKTKRTTSNLFTTRVRPFVHADDSTIYYAWRDMRHPKSWPCYQLQPLAQAYAGSYAIEDEDLAAHLASLINRSRENATIEILIRQGQREALHRVHAHWSVEYFVAKTEVSK